MIAERFKKPLIIAGDFNDWRTLLAPIFTDILNFECATNHSSGYHNPFLTYPAFSPTGGLDKIFYRGPMELIKRRRCWMGITRLASDHLSAPPPLRLSQSLLSVRQWWAGLSDGE